MRSTLLGDSIWSNGHSFSIIDRALVNHSWMLRMHITSVVAMDPLLPYYSPRSVVIVEQRIHYQRPFEFF